MDATRSRTKIEEWTIGSFCMVHPQYCTGETKRSGFTTSSDNGGSLYKHFIGRIFIFMGEMDNYGKWS